MFVCLCKGVTDRQIQQAVENGASSIKELRRELGVATQCCKCLPQAHAVINNTLEQQEQIAATMPEALYFPA